MYSLDTAIYQLNKIVYKIFDNETILNKISWGSKEFNDDPLKMIQIKKNKLIINKMHDMLIDKNHIWYLHALRAIIKDIMHLDYYNNFSWSASCFLVLLIKSELDMDEKVFDKFEYDWREFENTKGSNITNLHLFYSNLKHRRSELNVEYAKQLYNIIISADDKENLFMEHSIFYNNLESVMVSNNAIDYLKIVLENRYWNNKDIKAELGKKNISISSSTIAKLKSNLGILLKDEYVPNLLKLNMTNLYYLIPTTNNHLNLLKDFSDPYHINLWPLNDEINKNLVHYIVPISDFLKVLKEKTINSNKVRTFIVIPDRQQIFNSFPFSAEKSSWITVFDNAVEQVLVNKIPDETVNDQNLGTFKLKPEHINVLNEIISQQKTMPSSILTNLNSSKIRTANNYLKKNNFYSVIKRIKINFNLHTMLFLIPTTRYFTIDEIEPKLAKIGNVEFINKIDEILDENINTEFVKSLTSIPFQQINTEKLIEINSDNKQQIRQITLIEILSTNEDREKLLKKVGRAYYQGIFENDAGEFFRLPPDKIENGKWNFSYDDVKHYFNDKFERL